VVALSVSNSKADSEEEDIELDPKKKLRNLAKKLKEIEKLESREELNDAQKAKIANKPKIQKEMAELEKLAKQ
jgi:uncharacterized protein with WD repeat